MKLEKYIFSAQPHDHGKRIDRFLADSLSTRLGQAVSKRAAEKLVIQGSVYLNGKRNRIASKPVLGSSTVKVYLGERWGFETNGAVNFVREKGESLFEFTDSHILYHDDYLIAVDKPAGLPTHATLDDARQNVVSCLKKYLVNNLGIINPYLGLHHRLDCDTSGILLLTKKTEANKGIADQFSQHKIIKTYQAVSFDFSPKREKVQWIVKNELVQMKFQQKKIMQVVGGRISRNPSSVFAETHFDLLAQSGGYLWIEARPKTGRMHQIRVHLANMGYPILGDALYGQILVATNSISIGVDQMFAKNTESPNRMLLHAAGLTFEHPIHKNKISIQSSLHEDFKKWLFKLGLDQ